MLVANCKLTYDTDHVHLVLAVVPGIALRARNASNFQKEVESPFYFRSPGPAAGRLRARRSTSLGTG